MRPLRFAASTGIVAIALIVACASANTPLYTISKDGTITITQEQISRSSATNAWEVLKNVARRYTYIEDRSGRPLRIKGQRGASSMTLAGADEPLVIIDGARITELVTLADLPASAITRIDILNGITGTISQGTNASAGVIYIHTREGSSTP